MAKYKNIQEYRNKQKVKSFLKSSITIIIVLAILLVLASVLQVFNGTKLNDIVGENPEGEKSSFPVVIKDEQLLDLYNLGNGITVLTKGNLIGYLSNGKRGQKSSHGYTNPVVKESNKRLLTYDRGGNSFRVDTTSGLEGEIKLQNQIVSAQIAPNGNVAVVTNHNQYASIITVYDNKLTEIYKYSSGDRITLVDFSPDSKNIIATSIITQDGVISAALLELKITENTIAKKVIIKDILPLSTNYSLGTNITIIGSEKLITYNTKTDEKIVYEYKGELLKFSSSSINENVVVTKNLIDNTSIITVIDSNGIDIKNYNLNDDVKDIYCDGSRIIVLGSKAAYNFDMSLLLLDQIDLERPYNKIIYNGDVLYIMGTDIIEKRQIN